MTNEEQQNQPAEANEATASQTTASGSDTEPNVKESAEFSPEQMAALYDESLRNFKEGEVVRGKVVSVGTEKVLVDIGYKSEGVVLMSEFASSKEVTAGDEFDVYIEEPEDDEGMPVLSKLKADRIKNWAHVQEVYEEDGVIEGRIVRRVKGGLKVDIGIDAFMPASQLTWRPTGDLDKYIGQTMELKIIKLTKRRRNVVVSRRKLLEEQRAGEKEELLRTIEVGKLLKGEVKNITDFGAFVDVGGIDGLLHVTDMSWGRVKHPSQVVQVGQQIEVMVLNFDPQTERISLGLKQKSENPWKSAEQRYPVGGVVRGRVVSMTDYGAFVQLELGIEGMVHVSEMSWTHRVRHPNEMLSLDQEIDVMVLNVDPQAEKIALGIKQTQPNPWAQIAERYPVGSTVNGLVRNLTDYGAFVQIEEGIDGLLHVSDLSWTKKVAHPSEMLEKNQEIEVKILSVDPANEKISVGLKQLERDPWQEVVGQTPLGSHVQVEISKLVSFGAFARLPNGIEGLIHVSELSAERVQKPEEVLSIGDKTTAKVISIEPIERKIGLSIREYQRDKEEGVHAEYTVSGSTEAVSIGDVLGDAVPKSFLQEGRSLTDAANEMMADAAGQHATVEPKGATVPSEDGPAVDAPPEAAAPGPAAEAIPPRQDADETTTETTEKRLPAVQPIDKDVAEPPTPETGAQSASATTLTEATPEVPEKTEHPASEATSEESSPET